MNSPSLSLRAVLCAACLAVPALASAQTTPAPASELPAFEEEPVVEYNLSGPRLGATFTPDGTPGTQFGWHFEHQAAPGTRGPWFIVETVLLVGGVESDRFIPSGTLVFGVRLPNSLEFGVGPSVSMGGSSFGNAAVVLAAGHSMRFGGIRVPVNLAVALDKDGDERWTLLTGWAIRDRSHR